LEDNSRDGLNPLLKTEKLPAHRYPLTWTHRWMLQELVQAKLVTSYRDTIDGKATEHETGYQFTRFYILKILRFNYERV
jgi:hypothetical protein